MLQGYRLQPLSQTLGVFFNPKSIIIWYFDYFEENVYFEMSIRRISGECNVYVFGVGYLPSNQFYS